MFIFIDNVVRDFGGEYLDFFGRFVGYVIIYYFCVVEECSLVYINVVRNFLRLYFFWYILFF